MAQFSLSWNAYKQNICSGLSSLQQSGEFVDMTIAADGHHVKVHQMVMSLVSPYIKDLITSAQCPHPVIFLNKVSYETLCSILEYIYTGEVMVANENITDLLEAGKELHIKGLEDMKIELAATNASQAVKATSNTYDGQPLSERGYLRSKRSRSPHNNVKVESKVTRPKMESVKPIQEVFVDDNVESAYEDNPTFNDGTDSDDDDKNTVTPSKNTSCVKDVQVQYAVSNQGSIQLILNRFVYSLRYISKRDDGRIRWRCIEAWKTSKCRAEVYTKGNVVIQRTQSHNHPFHDKNIMKKVRNKVVFTTLEDAQIIGNNKKIQKQIIGTCTTPTSNKKNSITDDTTDAE